MGLDFLRSRKPVGKQAAAAFIILLCAIFFALFSAQKAQRPERVVIADAQQPGFGLIYIADEKGYFKEKGLEVAFKPFELGRDALKDVIDGESDLATVYETPVVRQIYGGKDVRIITSLHYAAGNTWLVANRSRGITTPADLAGKRILTSQGTSLDYFLRTLLSNYRIVPGDVTIISSDAILSSEVVARELNDGNIDAATVWNLSFDTIQEMADGDLVRFTSDTYTEISLLVSNRTFAAERRDSLERIAAALKLAEAYAARDPEGAKRIVRERSKTLTDRDFDTAWSQTELSARIDNYMLALLAEEAGFFRGAGTYSAPIPDFRNYVEDGPLRRVSPESVTIF